MGIVRKFKKFTLHLIATANLLVVAALCVTGYAGYFDPTHHPNFEVLTLLFPIPLLLNLAFLIFWLVFHYKYVWIPIVGFLICAPAVRLYCPINFRQKAPDDGLKVLSLNAHVFNYKIDNEKLPNPVVEYLEASGADIICLQEATIIKHGDVLTKKLKKIYPYIESEMHKPHERISVYSKYPIIRHERIRLDIKRNLCGAFYIDRGIDTILVVNCHLEGTGLSDTERDEFGKLVKRETTQIHKRSIIEKLGHTGRRHARQAKDVMAYVERQKGMSVVLCGDFNDSPLSYAHHVFAKTLTDCYKATGFGPGFTHRAHGMLVRIDHMMCSPDLEPFECEIDSKVNISDHYPIRCTLKKRQKSKK